MGEGCVSAMLVASWVLFIVAIISVLGPFVVTNKAADERLKYIEKYFLEDDDDAENGETGWVKKTDTLNQMTGGSFALAVILTVLFAAFISYK